MGIKFLQLNCQRSSSVLAELGVVLGQEGVDVALLQEPYAFRGRVAGLPLGTRVFSTGDNYIGSAVVVVNEGIEALLINELSGPCWTCVRLDTGTDSITVLSIYCRPNEGIQEYLEAIDRVLLAFRGSKVIVGADANATSQLWHSKGRPRQETEDRGREVEQFILARDLIVLNRFSEDFSFSGGNGESDIDVTIVNGPAWAGSEWGWCLGKNLSISDHSAIVIEMSTVNRHCGRDRVVLDYGDRARWSTNNADWGTYRYTLLRAASGIGEREFEDLGPDGKARMVRGWLEQTNRACLRKVAVREVRTVWWNNELEGLKRSVRKKKRLLRTANRRDDQAAIEERKRELRQALARYKKQIREAKLTEWKDRVRDSGNADPWGAVYRICRGRRRQELGSMSINGVRTRTWEETAEGLLGIFFGESRFEMRNGEQWDGAGEPARVTEEEVGKAIMSCASGKAPGLDLLTADMVKIAWEVLPSRLVSLYGECVRSGVFPSEWKRARVVVIPKSADRPLDDPASYRPICLLSVLGKVLEKVLVARLETRLTLHPSQFGFVRGRSTEDAWLAARESVEMSEKKYVLGLFVDFKGAFDNLEWCRILEKLEELGVPEIETWRSYFRDREVCMQGRVAEIRREVRKGCPQGSVCGPVLWNLAMDSLLRDLEREECRAVAYADDLLVMVQGDSRRAIEGRANECAAIIVRWGQDVGVDVNLVKTVTMLLRGRFQGNRQPRVRVGERAVRCVEELTYLGIRVGARFNFRPHFRAVRSKLVNVCGQLRRVLRKDWGLKRGAMTVWFRGLLAACALYGARVWADQMCKVKERSMMDACERVALLACLRVCRTVSTLASRTIMGNLPWWLEAQCRSIVLGFRRGNRAVVYGELDGGGYTGDSVREYATRVRDKAWGIWQREWEGSEKGRITYEWVRDVRFSAVAGWFEPSLPLGYLLTGHGSLNHFLWRRGLCESEECMCGAASETWEHVLVECAFYEEFRDLEAMGLLFENGRTSVEHVLRDRGCYIRVSEFAERAFRERRDRIG